MRNMPVNGIENDEREPSSIRRNHVEIKQNKDMMNFYDSDHMREGKSQGDKQAKSVSEKENREYHILAV